MQDLSNELGTLRNPPEKIYTRPALKKIFLELSGIPDWLLARCQKEGGDLAETLARCWPKEGPGLEGSPEEFIADVFPTLTEVTALLEVWNHCTTPERIAVNHLLLGHDPDKKHMNPPDPDAPRKTIQGELMYALLSGEPEYSFGLLRGAETVVFTRVSVPDPQLSIRLLEYIEKNTIEKKGPVRVVAPGLVGGISYTGFTTSSRHKSGLKVEDARLENLFPPGGLWQANSLMDL